MNTVNSDYRRSRAPYSQALKILILLSTLGGVSTALPALWINAKGQIAQQLLHQSWDKSITAGTGKKPWPWADTASVAQITFGDESHIVLSGGHGQSLAFGPTVISPLSGSLPPLSPPYAKRPQIDRTAPAVNGVSTTNLHRLNNEQPIVLAGHRDTHFAFLSQMKTGDTLTLQLLDGIVSVYRLAETHTLDASTQQLNINPRLPGLVLITCYPFNALQYGGSERYVALLQAVQPPHLL